jgi:hypothetical protein
MVGDLPKIKQNNEKPYPRSGMAFLRYLWEVRKSNQNKNDFLG